MKMMGNNRRKATWNILTCASKISQLVENGISPAVLMLHVERVVKKKKKNVEEKKK
jgi:hypothetical protein